MLGTRAFQGQNIMAPQDVAAAGYEALMKRELFVVPGGMNKALAAGRRILSEGAQARLNEVLRGRAAGGPETRAWGR